MKSKIKYLDWFYYIDKILKFSDNILKVNFRVFISKNIPYLYSRYFYRLNTGKNLDYKCPRDINEKLFWLSRYWKNSLVVKCADKYLVREYVKDCDAEEILVPLYNIYDNVDEIDITVLPESFVLKTNNGYSNNIICKDKAKIDIYELKMKLSNWLNQSFGYETAEYHYTKISPKIICEKYLSSDSEVSLIDYKIHCLNGKPYSILVCSERDIENHKLILSSYSLNWERQSFLINEEEHQNYWIEKPTKLDEMLRYAEKLSKPFPYVRVDFYYVENKIYFGEMTFTPAANIMDYYKQTTLDLLGDSLILPKKKKF